MPASINDQQEINFPFRNLSMPLNSLIEDDGPPPYIPPGYRGKKIINKVCIFK